MAKTIIFGVQDLAQLAYYYLKTDSPHEVVAFTVNKKYLPENELFEGLPVIPFEEVEDTYPPSKFKLFVPMTGKKMNQLRAIIYNEGKKKGYDYISYISSKASIFNNEIGENCFILEDNTIQPYMKIGDNVVLWSGNHLGHHGEIKDHVFFTSHVVLSGHCLVESYSWFGVNSTIKDSTHIAEGTLVGMSACVTKDTEPWSIYIGVPAKKQEKSSKEIDF